MAVKDRAKEATELAMEYQRTINRGELDRAFEMVLPKEREAVDKQAFIREKLGVDTIIENVSKFLPEIGKLEPVSATYDESTDVFRVTVREKFPDANMMTPIVSGVMADAFGLSGEAFDQQEYKDKVRKAIGKNKKLFKKGALLDVEITENVEEYEGKLYISPGWIEQIRKAEEQRALRDKAEALSTDVWRAQGYEGSIFEALKLYRKLVGLDESYAARYGDIEERALIAPKVSIEVIASDMESTSMEKVKITNGSDKRITSVNCECELLDEKGRPFHSEILQISQTAEPGESIESWAMFNSEAGEKRKGIRLKIVNVTLK